MAKKVKKKTALVVKGVKHAEEKVMKEHEAGKPQTEGAWIKQELAEVDTAAYEEWEEAVIRIKEATQRIKRTMAEWKAEEATKEKV